MRPEHYPLFVSQNPIVNAGAYGMDKPFIILNSGALALLNDDQISYVMGHEVGHVMSDHVLYKTMTELLLVLAGLGFPIVGLAARAILFGLLEWSRKSELSADRAGAACDPGPRPGPVVDAQDGRRRSRRGKPRSPNSFARREEYRDSGDLADQVFKVLNLLSQTHPFWVLRVSELRAWIEAGSYDRILRGEYQRRGEPDPAYTEDLSEAANAYGKGAKDVLDQMAGAARKVGETFWENFKR